jgi:hypothetical protein
VAACFAPLFTFRSAKTPNTTTHTTTMLSTVERPELTRRAETIFRILRVPYSEQRSGVAAEGEFYVLPINTLQSDRRPHVMVGIGSG